MHSAEWIGGRITKPLGYVILRVQIPYVPSYDEDQVALVVAEDSNFLRRCQVILGTPTINWAVRAMKESEMENAPEAWQSAQHTYEFANYMCDGFRALAAVSPGCLATVVKSHRTWIPTLCFHHPLNALQMVALRAAI